MKIVFWIFFSLVCVCLVRYVIAMVRRERFVLNGLECIMYIGVIILLVISVFMNNGVIG